MTNANTTIAMVQVEKAVVCLACLAELPVASQELVDHLTHMMTAQQWKRSIRLFLTNLFSWFLALDGHVFSVSLLSGVHGDFFHTY